jgi:hypothetical protein
MGAGANPAAWFFVAAFSVILSQFWLLTKKETAMQKSKMNRKTKAKPATNNLTTATIKTYVAVTVSWAAGLATHLIHAKSAPL